MIQNIRAHRWRGNHKCCFCHTVYRKHGFRIKTILSESVDKQSYGKTRYRLGPVKKDLDTRQVNSLYAFVFNHVKHPEKTEIRARYLRYPVLIYQDKI